MPTLIIVANLSLRMSHLRPVRPIQPVKYGLKLKVVLKWKDIYTENTVVTAKTS